MAGLRKGTTVLTILLLLSLFSSGLVFAAEPITVNGGSAQIDGVPTEWDITNLPPPDGTGDFIANLYLSGVSVDKEVLGKLYLRYDCVADGPNVLYALVLTEGDIPIFGPTDPGEHFIKYRLPNAQTFTKGVENDDAGSFAFVGSPETGWEARFEVPENVYELYVHTNVDYNGESQTAATVDLNIALACSPSAVSMATATAAPATSPTIILLGVGVLAAATPVVVRRRRTQ